LTYAHPGNDAPLGAGLGWRSASQGVAVGAWNDERDPHDHECPLALCCKRDRHQSERGGYKEIGDRSAREGVGLLVVIRAGHSAYHDPSTRRSFPATWRRVCAMPS